VIFHSWVSVQRENVKFSIDIPPRSLTFNLHSQKLILSSVYLFPIVTMTWSTFLLSILFKSLASFALADGIPAPHDSNEVASDHNDNQPAWSYPQWPTNGSVNAAYFVNWYVRLLAALVIAIHGNWLTNWKGNLCAQLPATELDC